jgi:hypothetical protein
MEEHGIGWAIKQLRNRAKVAREGWNGKGMWLELIHAREYTIHNHNRGPRNEHDHDWSEEKVQRPWIGMVTVDGQMVPWVASQTDLLATDWEDIGLRAQTLG